MDQLHTTMGQIGAQLGEQYFVGVVERLLLLILLCMEWLKQDRRQLLLLGMSAGQTELLALPKGLTMWVWQVAQVRLQLVLHLFPVRALFSLELARP